MSSIQLSGECTIYEIAHIHQQILDNWKTDTDLELDVSAITDVDASFVQLLASCKKQAETNEHAFSLINSTDTLNKKIKAMFMTEFFAADTNQI